MADLKHPDDSEATLPAPQVAMGIKATSEKPPRPGWHTVTHPSGREGYSKLTQLIRALGFTVYFTTCVITIVITQFVGAPLYFVNRQLYYDFMAMTKRSFAITSTVMTQIWGPTTIRISGDESIAGQIQPTEDGLVSFRFPERLVLIANHQIYTDWLYLWWVGYANTPGMHGHLYIILKQSLQWIPLIGTGMMFYGFIFMSRKMATDRPRMAYRLNKLKARKTDPRGQPYFDPMWLLLFPEGTNMSGNGRKKSASWAAKNGWKDPQHMMLPRSTGTFFCLNELKGTVEYVYDCTVAYEGIARGKYGEEIFGLSSTYFEGRPPKSVNFYWRRFKLNDIPLDDQAEFDTWLREQWYKKDEFMEQYMTTGRFPKLVGSTVDFIETEVRPRYPWEILQIFSVVSICALVFYNCQKLLSWL
ncbi:putative acyltransferase [Escovopsis weberi]|uniref:Putative acyltransferase n=1 Tax=Escovopsis weberi TaxID=150374 RepID=A0A0M8MTG0_ESCWE|nr:putative acyltransferase [Escovopsis weberi]